MRLWFFKEPLTVKGFNRLCDSKLISLGGFSTKRLFSFYRPLHKPHTFSTFNFIGANMKIVQVPVLSDNYSYLVIDEKSKTALAVDPAGPSEMLVAIKKEDVTLTTILTTHHHGDHAGGNSELSKSISGIKIYGGDKRVEAVTDIPKDGDHLQIGSLQVKVYFTPCHTSGHVLYEVWDTNSPKDPHALFTGDTLFVSGCGRFFEGTAQQMCHALLEVVAKFPHETQVFCGHEYTVKNLEFASTIETKNKAVKEKLEWAKKQRAQNLSTIPSTVGEELTYNPFMRVREMTVGESLGLLGASPIEVMAELRKRKDKF